MFAAPLLLLASTIAFVTLGDGINDGLEGGVVTVWAAIAVGLAFLGCARFMEPRAPRAAAVVTFTGIGAAVGGAGFGHSAIYLWILDRDHGVDAEAAINAHPFSLLSLLPWGWFMPVTCIVVGGLLWRTRLVPWWHGVLFILGGVLFVTGRPARIDGVAIATDVVLLLAFGLLALRVLTEASSGTRTAAQPAPARAALP